MIYLEQFRFASWEAEDMYVSTHVGGRESAYPFYTLCYKEFKVIDFAPITLLVGGNGSGKSTVLNVIARRLNILRKAAYNTSRHFESYANLCEIKMTAPIFAKILTSDDIFMKMQESRTKGGYQPRYEYSNGEVSYNELSDLIEDNGLYLLDEPENCMASHLQQHLADIIVDAAQYGNCQFIIATHSPFLMSMPYAKIYCLDDYPVTVKEWWQIENMRLHYELFKSFKSEFETGRPSSASRLKGLKKPLR
jgi:predicted ATPase